MGCLCFFLSFFSLDSPKNVGLVIFREETMCILICMNKFDLEFLKK